MSGLERLQARANARRGQVGRRALAIIALWQTDPTAFWSLSNKGSIISGGVAYLFIALLADHYLLLNI